ncbi:MAG: transposase family protein [Streptomycetaceae bacterium]|nr:transposase family protein [Streptomycetaceae bacterium]
MPSCLIEDVARTLDNLELPRDQMFLDGSREVMTLVDALTLVDDPRRKQGRRYPFTGLLTVAVVAVLGGARSLAAIVRWAKSADAHLLDALGLPHGTHGRVPAATTWGRTLAKTDGDQLDDTLALFTETLARDPLEDITDTGPRSLAADGKTVRGALDADGKQLHLLSIFRPDTGTIAAQRAMRDKGCEVTHFSAALGVRFFWRDLVGDQYGRGRSRKPTRSPVTRFPQVQRVDQVFLVPQEETHPIGNQRKASGCDVGSCGETRSTRGFTPADSRGSPPTACWQPPASGWFTRLREDYFAEKTSLGRMRAGGILSFPMLPLS